MSDDELCGQKLPVGFAASLGLPVVVEYEAMERGRCTGRSSDFLCFCASDIFPARLSRSGLAVRHGRARYRNAAAVPEYPPGVACIPSASAEKSSFLPSPIPPHPPPPPITHAKSLQRSSPSPSLRFAAPTLNPHPSTLHPPPSTCSFLVPPALSPPHPHLTTSLLRPCSGPAPIPPPSLAPFVCASRPAAHGVQWLFLHVSVGCALPSPSQPDPQIAHPRDQPGQPE